MSKQNQEKIIVQALDQIMADRFGRYAKYIIQGRALPDARDGLKPVQRRILFAMHELGLTYQKPFKKSARVVGEVIGKYHPHGDSSIYEAMVRMSQSWKMNHPLISMHGNNGSIDDDPAAAMRYTEARLAPIAQELLVNLKFETVPFTPNFDDSEIEPTVLPGLIPNLLVNGAKGIAAGYATEMPPHNLGEVIAAIIHKIKWPQANLKTLMKYLPGPDFPTGGIIHGQEGLYSAFERGKGKIIIRAKYEVKSMAKVTIINIKEIPYGVNKAKLVREIDELRFNKKINGIKNVSDQSDRHGISIVIELKEEVDYKIMLNYLFAKTSLQIYYTYNNVAIKDLAPQQMGLIALIDAYLAHQIYVQRQAITYQLKKYSKRYEILQGLIKVTTITNQIITLITQVQGSKQGVIEALKTRFNFTTLQAEAIAELRLYRLSRTDKASYLQEQKALTHKINFAQKLLTNESEFNQYLIKQLQHIKQNYARNRLSLIENEVTKVVVNESALMAKTTVWIGLSRQGYLKRLIVKKNQDFTVETYPLKADDQLIYWQKNLSSDKLLIITSLGKYLIIVLHKIKETKWAEFGFHLNDYLVLAHNEFIINAFPIRDFMDTAYLLTVSAQGKIKRSSLKLFASTKLIKTGSCMLLDHNDQLVAAALSNSQMQVIVLASNNKAVRYSEVSIPINGLKSKGVKAMNLPLGVMIQAMTSANNNGAIGLISDRGALKRIHVKNIRPFSRQTQGQKLFKPLLNKSHHVQAMALVNVDDRALIKKIDQVNKSVVFKDVPFSTSDEGFSKTKNNNNCLVSIINQELVAKDNPYFKISVQPETEDKKFLAAEEKINQLALDDLLKEIS